MKISRLFILSFLSACSALSLTAQEVDPSEDLGRLPESFSLETDSLLNARYRDYYAYSKKSASRDDRSSKTSDELYRSRLRAMESVIPLPYNPVVREAIEMYLGGGGVLISRMLARSSMYFPIIEEELDREGLPLELKYLSIVESALNPTAVSRSGAAGLWQFMLRTGKVYGLHIDSLVDERMDPKKSTDAAAKYFKDLYAIYGDWLLAIAAYNCGPGSVNKAIQKAGGDGRNSSFWDVYRFLPRQTRSYVPFFIAAYYSMEHYREHNIRPSAVRLPLATDTVHVASRVSFGDLSRLLDIGEDELRQLNPSYRKGIVPGNNRPMVLRLPSSVAPLFEEKMPLLASAAENAYREVQEEAAQIKDTPSKSEKKKASSKRYYKVKKGDTLSRIAKKYKGVTINEIKRANGMKSTKLKPGQRLIIPN